MKSINHNGNCRWRRRVAGLAALFVVTGALRAAEPVVLLKSRAAPQYDQAVAGFLEQWQKLAPATPVELHTLTDPAPELRQPVAVVTVGTEATEWALARPARPVVFCMVANPQQRVLAELRAADTGRVFGVSLNIPARDQLQAVQAVLPELKRIGIIFDPQKSAATVAEARQAATGLGLTVLVKPVASEQELPAATTALAGRIDALWAPVDNTVFNPKSAQFVLLRMLQQQVSVIGFSENMVKAGALVAPRVDYADSGRQTADLLAQVVRGETAAVPVVQAPRAFDLVVNGHVSRLLGRPVRHAARPTVVVINED